MVTPETYLKTQQVAEALGVSVSSVKRWVDAGALQATRTMGRHRLVLLSSALSFAQREQFPVEGLLAISPSNNGSAVHAQLCERLLDALKSGDDQLSTALILSVYQDGAGVVDLADQLIRPAMERIGQGWFLGQWDVYEEHLATSLLITTLTGINQSLIKSTSESRPLALGATPSGDPYVLPGLLAEIVVRGVGWNVRNLGCDLPLRSLAEATRRFRPRMIFLSASHIADRDLFVSEYSYFYESASLVGAAVMLGGRAFDHELRSRLVFASFGDRMAHLSEFARQILPSSENPLITTTDDPR